MEEVYQVTKLSHDGRGIGQDLHGKTIFIDGALPGEEVTLAVNKNRRQFKEAKAISIHQASADRVAAQCPHADVCGGCSLQHIAPTAQLNLKQTTLLEHLQSFGQVAPANILPPLTADIWGYRTKARLGVKFVIKKDKLLVGFREKRNSYIADLDSCEILHPSIGKLITTLKQQLELLQAKDKIAQIEVAVGDDQLALIFRNLVSLSSNDLQHLVQLARLYNFDLYLQPGGPNTVTRVYNCHGFSQERLQYTLQLPSNNSLQFQFHPTDFTQVNPKLNNKMVNQALQLLDLQSDDVVLDLFCGIGNFSLPLASYAKKVVGVEGSEVMVTRAYENAKINSIDNVEFYAADLTQINVNSSWLQEKYSVVLLDPPRSGAQESLVTVAELNPKKILYVACNTATLARDCGILCNEHGYKLESAGIMDMFPHTAHVEAMALLSK